MFVFITKIFILECKNRQNISAEVFKCGICTAETQSLKIFFIFVQIAFKGDSALFTPQVVNI